MTANGFVRQFAVMMPNGELYRHQPTPQTVDDYSIPSPVRDMLGMLGVSTTQTATPPPLDVAIFTNRRDAERVVAELRKQAALFGVTLWGGTVVERLCTPFTSTDPGAEFRDAVIGWLQQRHIAGGES